MIRTLQGKFHKFLAALTFNSFFSQTLDEAIWMKDAIFAFDLVANLMNEKEKAFVEHNLFRSIAKRIKENTITGNWQSWHNAAISAVGYCFNDMSLVNYALAEPQGNSQFIVMQ